MRCSEYHFYTPNDSAIAIDIDIDIDMVMSLTVGRGSSKVFGFVSAGIAAGGALAPTMFGYIMDAGKPEWVFYSLAIFMAVAVVTVAIPKAAK